MRFGNLLAVLTLGLSGTVFADSVYVSATCTSQTVTNCKQTANSAAGNEPTASTPGVPLTNVCGVRVVLAADSGQTLSGAGTVKFWLAPVRLGTGSGSRVFGENRRVTLPVPAGCTTRVCPFEDLNSLIGSGTLYVEAESVTTSSGDVSVVVETSTCRGTR